MKKRTLSNMKRLVIVLVVLPMLGMLTISAILIATKLQTYQNATATIDLTEQATKLTALVHAMQVERGQSAGFLASGGKNFTQTLPGVRETTDAAITALGDAHPTLLNRLANLSTQRLAVDDQALTVPQMAGWYTGNINAALALSNDALLLSLEPEILRLGNGWAALAQAKESAGLQRAAGATGLGAGAFSPKVFNGFVSLGAIERKSLGTAMSLLDEIITQELLDDGIQRSDVGAFRTAIIDAGVNAAPEGLTAPDWFASSTAWIDGLREIELTIASLVSARAESISTAALVWLVISASTTVAAMVVASVIGLRTVSTFNYGMEGLLNAMKRLRERDFDKRPRNRDLSTDIGRLFAAIDDTREDLHALETERAEADAIRQSVLSEMKDALRTLSEGDLTHSIDTTFSPDYEQLRDDFNTTSQQLLKIVGGLNDAVATLDTSSVSLSAATSDIARRTHEQTAALDETTTTLGHLTQAVTEAAQNARDARSMTQSLRKEASSGRGEVERAIPVMKDIAQAAEEMRQMVTLIDDIAFQTNLLALNAGVEAARAGEAGRGFAVVAGEVRTLAASAGSTANDIKQLIEETNRIVKSGVSMVEHAVNAFVEIDTNVEKANASVSKIADDAEAQAHSIAEIKSAIGAVDDATRKNADAADNCDQQTASVKTQASQVQTLAAWFNVGSKAKDETADTRTAA